MPLYRCTDCGCVENTALGWFHCTHLYKDNPQMNKPKCSECGPKKYEDGGDTGYGKWHGSFEKKSATGWFVDTTGYIWENAKGSHCFGELLGKYKDDGTLEPLTEEERAINLDYIHNYSKNMREQLKLNPIPTLNKGRMWVTLSNKKSKQKKKK